MADRERPGATQTDCPLWFILFIYLIRLHLIYLVWNKVRGQKVATLREARGKNRLKPKTCGSWVQFFGVFLVCVCLNSCFLDANEANAGIWCILRNVICRQAGGRRRSSHSLHQSAQVNVIRRLFQITTFTPGSSSRATPRFHLLHRIYLYISLKSSQRSQKVCFLCIQLFSSLSGRKTPTCQVSRAKKNSRYAGLSLSTEALKGFHETRDAL